MAIHLGRPLPNASRDRPERRLESTPGTGVTPCLPLLLGLAPGGVFPAVSITGDAVRSYRTISPLPPMVSPKGDSMRLAVCFLWHCPWGRPRRPLTGTVLSVEPGLSSPPIAGKSGHPTVWRWDDMGQSQEVSKALATR